MMQPFCPSFQTPNRQIRWKKKEIKEYQYSIDSCTGRNERKTEKKIERFHKVIYNNEAKEFLTMGQTMFTHDGLRSEKERQNTNIETNMQEL